MTKKYLALALGAMLVCGGTVLFSGCTKDRSENIVGTWHRTAFYWSYSGSPNASANYSSGGPMNELDGASDMKFVFNEDKSGMMIEEWFSGPNEHGIDTTYFTYTIDGDEGAITLIPSGEKVSWTTTWAIQDIEEERMIVHPH